MKTHELKTRPVPFRAITSGAKTFEVRVNDRDYQEGDRLLLREWDHAYSGREVHAEIGYIFKGMEGLPWPEGVVVFALRTVAMGFQSPPPCNLDVVMLKEGALSCRNGGQ